MIPLLNYGCQWCQYYKTNDTERTLVAIDMDEANTRIPHSHMNTQICIQGNTRKSSKDWKDELKYS